MIRALPFVFAGLAAVAPLPRRSASAPVVNPDSLAIRRDAETRVSEFIGLWREAWKRSDTERAKNPLFARTRTIRNAYLHCHPQTPANLASARPDSFPDRIRPHYAPVVSRHGLFAVCPTWILGDRTSDVDEADSVDVALLPPFAGNIVRARGGLIVALDSLQALSPLDGWIIGQRVRFRLDAGAVREAHATAASCAAAEWWCTTLRAYVAHAVRDQRAADSLFTSALAAMEPQRRCEWLDVGVLLPADDRAAYQSRNCADRTATATTYFWLADPLLADSTNERRTEHLARRTMVALHADEGQDERHSFDDKRGGDAVVEMLVRYGVPSTAVWTGRSDEGSHSGYLNRAGRAAPPYSTAEYSMGRVQYAPRWRAVVKPSEAMWGDWQLHSPVGMWSVLDHRDEFWWPAEHMRDLSRRIAQLTEPGQVAFWPRQHAVRTAAIVDLTNQSFDARAMLANEMTATLLASSSPERTDHLAHRTIARDAALIIDGELRARHTILGIELADTTQRMALRTRFGITPPEPLDSLAPTAIALSDPVLFSNPRDGAQPTNAGEVIPRLRPNTVLTTDRTIGVFWECYGLAVGDSVRVSVRVVPVNEPGLLRRVLSAVKLAADGATTISVAWREAPGGASGNAIGSSAIATRASTDRSITPRSIILDLAGAAAGEYWLEVAATTASGRTASAHRRITVR